MRADIKGMLLVACAVAVFAAAFGVRAMDVSKWNSSEAYRVDGERILATHDAYAWLAGARGVGLGTGSPLARLARGVSAATGASMETVAFWAPAVAAGLVAVVTALWAVALGAPEAALCAGMLATIAPGYYMRSRLGYYDTDMVTLLFPLLHGVLLSLWLGPWLRTPLDLVRRGRGGHAPADAPGPRETLAWPVGIGLAAVACGGQWHHNIPDYYAMAYLLAAALVVLLGRRGARRGLVLGLVLLGMTAFFGVWGAVTGAGLAAVLWTSPRWRRAATAKSLPLTLALVAVMVLAPDVRGLGASVADKLLLYAKSSAVDVWDAAQHGDNASSSGAGPAYPNVVQSIIEAGNVDPMEVLGRLGGSAWYVVSGLCGFALVLIARPGAVFLAPLAVMPFLAVRFGSRFAMFGGPVVALGLAVAVVWLARQCMGRRRGVGAVALAASLCVGIVVFVPAVRGYSTLGVSPVIDAPHGKALKALGEFAPQDSMVWTWWDYGYATMYYSGRMTFADGGRHTGRYLYPLAKALSTPSPQQAAQIMRFAALEDDEPWRRWDDMTARQVRDMMLGLARPGAVPPAAGSRYLVVTWENLALASWITYFGTWDPVLASGTHGLCRSLRHAFTVDFDTGTVEVQGRRFRVATVDQLTREGREFHAYPGAKLHLVINVPASRAYVMDDATYASMLVQLLLVRPDSPRLDGALRLVYEGFPYVRIYEGL